MAIPATRAIAGGPKIRYWLWAADRPVRSHAPSLWWVPLDDVVADADVLAAARSCSSRPRSSSSYVVVAVGRTRLTGFGSLLVVAGAESLAIFTASVLRPRPQPRRACSRRCGPSRWPSASRSLALNRLRDAQDAAARQNRMRDALARLANAAWFVKDADGLLLTARDEARTILRDPSIEGSLRPIARDRFVTELFSVGQGRALAAGPDVPDRPRADRVRRRRALPAQRAAARHRVRRPADPPAQPACGRGAPPGECSSGRTSSARASRSSTATSTGSSASTTRSGTPTATRSSSGSPTTCAHALDRARLLRRAGRRRRVRHRARPGAAGRRPGRASPGPSGRASSTATAGSRPARLTVGVATWLPGDVVDADALVRHADTAMLEAKRSRSGLPRLRPCAAAPGRGRAAPARRARGGRRRRALHRVLPADRRRARRWRSSRSRRSPGGTTTVT